MRSNSDPHGRHALRCMEIWGGSHVVEETIATPGLEARLYSKPYEGAAQGGDVHYVSLCGGGIITRIIVADVSGHGAAVAQTAVALRSLMRKNINRKNQTRLVRALNRQFVELAQLQRFATAVVITYLASKRSLTVCNAGHPRPLWYQKATGTWSLLTQESAGGANLPLGLDEETTYEQFAIALSPGDLVILYTDALTESQPPDGPMLGEVGLLEMARGLDPSDLDSLGRRLIDGVGRYRNGPADDDETLLVLHHTAGPRRRPSVGEKLDVYAKVFGLKKV